MLYECDPKKNTACEKTHCFINGGECHHTTVENYKMEVHRKMHEIRYYLIQILSSMDEEVNGENAFKPAYFITAVKLPNGAIELAVNTERIKEKIEYILDAYNEDMQLKTNTEIQMQNLMVV